MPSFSCINNKNELLIYLKTWKKIPDYDKKEKTVEKNGVTYVLIEKIIRKRSPQAQTLLKILGVFCVIATFGIILAFKDAREYFFVNKKRFGIPQKPSNPEA